ncbi:MAG TPA: hypothetical protein DD671_16040, partial [Balneolaceae bacterium]|nr:hypothetical protein [Balneolaceae bacterium]
MNRDSLITKKELDFSENPYIHFELLLSHRFTQIYSKDYLEEAVKEWSLEADRYLKDGEELNHSLIVSNIIWASYFLDDFQTLTQYSDKLVSSKSLPYSIFRMRIYGAIDYSYYTTQQYDKSLKLQREHSLPLANFLGDKEQIWKIKIRQGVYLYSLGKYEESKNVYEELYAQSHGEDFYLLTNLSNNYYKLGYSNKYISFQLRALEFEFKDYRNLLNVYRNLFLYYTANKDISSALQYIEKAKEVAVNNNDSTELALIDSYLGTFYWTQYRDHKKALENFDAAQQVLSPSDNYIKYIDLLGEKGDVYFRIDSLSKAREIFKSAKDLALSKSNTVDYLDALINLAAIELKQNNMQAAEEIFDEINLYPLDDVDFPLLT